MSDYFRHMREKLKPKSVLPDNENGVKPSEGVKVKADTLSETARVRVRQRFARFWNDKRS